MYQFHVFSHFTNVDEVLNMQAKSLILQHEDFTAFFPYSCADAVLPLSCHVLPSGLMWLNG